MEIISKLNNTSPREIIKLLGLRFYRFDAARKVIIPFVKQPRPKKWVFIVACCNSGTTLLTKLLGTHSDISSLPEEGVWLTNRLPRSEDFGWPRVWCMCKDKVYMNEKNSNVNVDKLKKEWGFWFDSKKDVFLEKSSLNSIRMRWLQKNFHPSYFISVVRNGYAVVEGIQRKARTDISAPILYKPPHPFKQFKGMSRNYSVDLCAKQWVESNLMVEEDSKYINNLLKIKYEDLTEKPDEILSKIFSFLSVENKFDSVGGKKWIVRNGNHLSPIINMNPKSINVLSNNDIIRINEIAGDTLLKYGYELLRPD